MLIQYKTRRRIKSIAIYLVLVIVVIIAIFPFYWLVSMSLKTRADTFMMPPKWIFHPTFSNYWEVFSHTTKGSFSEFYKNSVVIGFSTMLVALIIGVPAGYSLARLKLPGKKDLSFLVLTMRMAPPIGVIIPLFLMMQRFGLIDTYPGLILIYLTFNLPFVVWMMRGFFKEIPIELEEAAMLDGCSRLGAFRFILPLVSPGLMATAIMCLIFTWNEFFYALIMTGKNTKTAPVAITSFMRHMGIEWGHMTAAGFSIVIPVIVFTLLVQKNLVRGLTMGAVKK